MPDVYNSHIDLDVLFRASLNSEIRYFDNNYYQSPSNWQSHIDSKLNGQSSFSDLVKYDKYVCGGNNKRVFFPDFVDHLESICSEEESKYETNTLVSEGGIQEQLNQYKSIFVEKLIQAYKCSDYSSIKQIFDNFLRINKDSSLVWFQNLCFEFIETKQNTMLMAGIELLSEYEYGALDSIPKAIVIACRQHKDPQVKATAFSLLDTWCNKESLELLEKFDEPTEPWLKRRYYHLKEVIKAKNVLFETSIAG